MNQLTKLHNELKTNLLELMFLQNTKLETENAMLREIYQLHKQNSVIYQALETIKGG